MIYDIAKTKMEKLIADKRLIDSIISVDGKLSRAEAIERVMRHWDKAQSLTKKKNEVKPVNVDHPPCGVCGCTIFIKTGVCHTCSNCAASTSCS